MSDTPETDAKASEIIGFFSCATVPANFARNLERQRNEARKEALYFKTRYEILKDSRDVFGAREAAK